MKNIDSNAVIDGKLIRKGWDYSVCIDFNSDKATISETFRKGDLFITFYDRPKSYSTNITFLYLVLHPILLILLISKKRHLGGSSD
jgi:hypothetical protein